MADSNQMIRARVDAFVADLTDLIHQAILENIQQALGQASVPVVRRGPGRPRLNADPAAAPAPSKRGRKRGGKRTAAELADMAAAVVAYVESNPGSNIEEVGRGVGIPTKDLALPVKKLLKEGKLKKKGEKRATRYSPGRR